MGMPLAAARKKQRASLSADVKTKLRDHKAIPPISSCSGSLNLLPPTSGFDADKDSGVRIENGHKMAPFRKCDAQKEYK